MFSERLKDVVRNDTITFVINSVLGEVFVYKGTAFLLELEMGCAVVWRGQAAEVGRLGEWERVRRVGCHDSDVILSFLFVTW